MEKGGLVIALIGLLILGVLLVSGAGCSKCNKPYIRVGSECCLDQDDNKICDKDETQGNTSKDLAELEVFAKKFGRALEDPDLNELYDMILPDNRAITRNDFIQLFPLVWGKDPYISVIYTRADIEEKSKEEYVQAIGHVYYDTTYEEGVKILSPSFTFLRLSDGWYFSGFDVSGLGCFNKTYCYEGLQKETLEDLCPNVCQQRDLMFSEISENQFSCDNYICYCVCWRDETEYLGDHIYPYD